MLLIELFVLVLTFDNWQNWRFKNEHLMSDVDSIFMATVLFFGMGLTEDLMFWTNTSM